MGQTRIYITNDIPSKGVDLLRREGFEVTVWTNEQPLTREQLVEAAKANQALLSTSADNLDGKFLQECNHLEIISQFAAGYDNIDISAATRLGIPIGNAPHAMSNATADIAFGLMIAASRKMFHLHKSIIRGQWKYFRPKANLGMELKNKTLGIFGLGQIGMEMAKRCKGAYNMRIIYCNRKPNPVAENLLGAEKVDWEELLKQSDVLSVHSVLSAETKGIFNKAAFDQMKQTAIFVNTSRGGLHNEQDLTEALQAGTIWGAGLDVTNPEPMASTSPLLQMENVAVLPHVGSATIEARDEMSRLAAMNIIEFYRNRQIPHFVNPEVWAKQKDNS